MNILEALWMGKISPIEGSIHQGSPYHTALLRAIDLDQQLRPGLDARQMELFDACADAETEMLGIAECEAFIRGFRLGTQMLLAALEKV